MVGRRDGCTQKWPEFQAISCPGAEGGIGPSEVGRVCVLLRPCAFLRNFAGSVIPLLGQFAPVLAAFVSYPLAADGHSWQCVLHELPNLVRSDDRISKFTDQIPLLS